MGDDLTNEETVPQAIDRGRAVLEAFVRDNYHGTPDPLTVEGESVRKDLLADLLHEAEAAGEDVPTLLQRALVHYGAERDADEPEYGTVGSALLAEAGAREDRAVELEENEEGVYEEADWKALRDRAAYLRLLAQGGG